MMISEVSIGQSVSASLSRLNGDMVKVQRLDPQGYRHKKVFITMDRIVVPAYPPRSVQKRHYQKVAELVRAHVFQSLHCMTSVYVNAALYPSALTKESVSEEFSGQKSVKSSFLMEILNELSSAQCNGAVGEGR